ncbi:MAG: acyl-CoA desaturase [Bacteroidia bacterium]|nr:acyl-CoA desaturase [Bacteroidia bacterium]
MTFIINSTDVPSGLKTLEDMNKRVSGIKYKIKFPVQKKPDFINELRKRVELYFETNNISKYGNAGMAVKSVIMVSVYLTPYILMMSGVIESLTWIFLNWILMGIGMAGVGMVLMHDANHGTYSKSRKINKLLAYSLYFLGGFPPTWQYQHNTLHHGFTNIDGQDEDIDPIGFLRFSPHKPLHKIHKYQYLYAWFFYGLLTLSWITIKDFRKLYLYQRKGANLDRHQSFRRLKFNLILSKILYYMIFLVIPMILLPVSWSWILLSFLAMHFTSSLILSVIFQSAHVMPGSEYPLPDEQGNMENNWAIHQLLTTTDYSPKSRVFFWWVGGLNYQVEHHLFPNICHIHYRNISNIVKSTALKYDLPYHVETNFFRAIRKHASMLRILGNKTAVINSA